MNFDSSVLHIVVEPATDCCRYVVALVFVVVELLQAPGMISEALVLFVIGGRVSHSWCLCVVGHGYGGLDGGRDGGGGWYVCGTKSGSWSHVGRSRSTSRVRGDALMSPDHIAVQVRSSG